MAIVAQFNLSGVGVEQYDLINNGMREKGIVAPEGRLYHVACPTDDGLMVFTVWESSEKLAAHAETLRSFLTDAGVTFPQPAILPVHNIIAG